ncbi:SMP-30/gluconolactonase/LRE family protein [Pseudoduganella violaceinigra]|uniref:SMP-30/gluconolactonase/LRE family protein n=1 Tax=Pseudoduganella violaceinigra TaxID=246602 RepID=UPI000401FBF2|nr:SMP-30/gluconolactonase/LRE family protein [Pseudoduganella violaceinigra]
MKSYIAQCVLPIAAELGEGPLYLPAQDRLLFVDLKRCILHAWDASTRRHDSWLLPDYLCWIVPRRDGDGFMAGLRDSVVRLWLEPALRIAPLVRVVDSARGLRLNDAKADQHGRLWLGSMHDSDYQQAAGMLFRLDPDLRLHIADEGYHICNGPTFAPDGRTLYHSDSFIDVSYRYPLAADGSLGPREVWRRFSGRGSPDGMQADSEGCIWIAQWGGARVCRFSPDGELLAEVPLPVSQPASLAFGGEDLRTLYITTAREGLSAEQLALEPLAGALFTALIDVPGLPANAFGAG